MRKNDFVSELTSCNSFALLPVVSDGISSSFSFSMIVAFLCFVMYLSYIGTSTKKVFLAGLVFLFSFSRINFRLCLGAGNLFAGFVDIDHMVRIASFVVAYVLIVIGLLVFINWARYNRQSLSNKQSLLLPAFLMEKGSLENRGKIAFFCFLKNVFFLVFVPYVVAYFIGLLSFGSPTNMEVAYNFLEVVKFESLESAYFKLFVYLFSCTMPLIIVWFLILFIAHNRNVANKLRKYSASVIMVFSAILMAVGVGFVLVFYNNIL